MPVAPISPSAAMKPANIDAHVERINLALSGEWNSYARTYGKSIATQGMTGAAVEQVQSTFRAAGWEVDRNNDRDGDYLTFKPPTRPA
jgi:hypothetical protein